MALPGLSFIQSHAQSFFFNSSGTIYRVDSSTNDGAGGLTVNRLAYQTIRCALEVSFGRGADQVEGEQPRNQQLFDLIYSPDVTLQADDEIQLGDNRYAVVGHVSAMTNEATRRTQVKLISQPNTVDDTPGETEFPGALDEIE